MTSDLRAYIALLDAFLSRRLSSEEFQAVLLPLFKGDQLIRPAEILDPLNEVFLAAEAYRSAPEKTSRYAVGSEKLYAVADAARSRLEPAARDLQTRPSKASWAGEPFAIHLGVDGSLAKQLESEARASEASLIRLDLSGLHDRAALAERLTRTFMFPNETRGLDAAIDLISDLGWFGNPAGYLVVVEGMDQAPEIIEPFVSILPNIIDRWRTQGRPFVVVLRATSFDRLAATELVSANLEMEAAGSLPWAQPGTGAVVIVNHSSERG